MKILVIMMVFINCAVHAQSFEEQIRARNIQLFTPSKPIANYVKAVRSGNLIFLAGHGPTRADGTNITGKVGTELTVEEGIDAARVAAIALLSSLKAEIGSLDKVKRIVKVNGWVNCPDDFKDQPKVMNGCSDLLVEIFGDSGRHARTSLGANALPMNIAVEIEMVVEIND